MKTLIELQELNVPYWYVAFYLFSGEIFACKTTKEEIISEMIDNKIDLVNVYESSI